MDVEGEEDIIDKRQLLKATEEVTKALTRNIRTRKKGLRNVIEFLQRIIPNGDENAEIGIVRQIVGLMDVLRLLIVEVVKLFLTLSDQNRGEDMRREVTTLSRILESLIKHLDVWCANVVKENDAAFFTLTEKLLFDLIKLVADTDSWRYVDVLYSPVIFILMKWYEPESIQDQRITWCKLIGNSMLKIERIVMKCEDFYCQYFLIMLLQQWMQWIGTETSESFLATAFQSASYETRQILMDFELSDNDSRTRLFLNSLNSRGGVKAFSIICLHFFVGEREMLCPKDSEFWVDFSVPSNRIHVFFAIEGRDCMNLNIEGDQIDSICVSVLRTKRNGNISQPVTQPTQTQYSQFTNLESDSQLLLHIKLSENIEELATEFAVYDQDPDIRSLVFVFKECAQLERILQQMSFTTHVNGKSCTRPEKLMKILDGNAPKIETISPPCQDRDNPDNRFETSSAFYIPCSSSSGSQGTGNSSKNNDGLDLPSSEDEFDRVSNITGTKSSFFNMTMESLMEDPIPRSLRNTFGAPPSNFISSPMHSDTDEEPSNLNSSIVHNRHSTPYTRGTPTSLAIDEPSSPVLEQIQEGQIESQPFGDTSILDSKTHRQPTPYRMNSEIHFNSQSQRSPTPQTPKKTKVFGSKDESDQNQSHSNSPVMERIETHPLGDTQRQPTPYRMNSEILLSSLKTPTPEPIKKTKAVVVVSSSEKKTKPIEKPKPLIFANEQNFNHSNSLDIERNREMQMEAGPLQFGDVSVFRPKSKKSVSTSTPFQINSEIFLSSQYSTPLPEPPKKTRKKTVLKQTTLKIKKKDVVPPTISPPRRTSLHSFNHTTCYSRSFVDFGEDQSVADPYDITSYKEFLLENQKRKKMKTYPGTRGKAAVTKKVPKKIQAIKSPVVRNSPPSSNASTPEVVKAKKVRAPKPKAKATTKKSPPPVAAKAKKLRVPKPKATVTTKKSPPPVAAKVKRVRVPKPKGPKATVTATDLDIEVTAEKSSVGNYSPPPVAVKARKVRSLLLDDTFDWDRIDMDSPVGERDPMNKEKNGTTKKVLVDFEDSFDWDNIEMDLD